MTPEVGYPLPNKHVSGICLFLRGRWISEDFCFWCEEPAGLDVDISEKIKPCQWEKLPWR